MIVWIIGLAGSGKTTLGRELVDLWRQEDPRVVHLDGDRIREAIGPGTAFEPYSVAGRRLNAERMTSLCEMLDAQDTHVVCSILSIFPDMRRRHRDLFSGYTEVYVSTSLEICSARDTKNLYAPALMGRRSNVVGVDIPFPEPVDADLVVDNGAPGAKPRELAREILRSVRSQRSAVGQQR